MQFELPKIYVVFTKYHKIMNGSGKYVFLSKHVIVFSCSSQPRGRHPYMCVSRCWFAENETLRAFGFCWQIHLFLVTLVFPTATLAPPNKKEKYSPAVSVRSRQSL